MKSIFRPLEIAIAAILSAAIALMVVGALGMAQSPPAPGAAASKYQPTEVQALKLQVAQRDAQLAQIQLQRAQAAFQGALAKLDELAGQVKLENKWPAEVQFSPDTLQFETPPKPPPAPMPSARERKPPQ